MKSIYLLLMIFFTGTSFSQEKTFKYYNDNDSIVSLKEATKYSVEYLDVKTNRIYKEFYEMEHNEITKRAYYINDTVMDGLLVNYVKNRQVWDSGYMKMGGRNGITYFYHNNGKLASIIDFKDDTSLFLHCYNREGLEEKCSDNLENMPEFPGGIDGLRQFLVTNIIYPKKAKENGIDGKVVVEFAVDDEGKIKNPVVIKNVDPLLDAEALRVVKKMPNWKPGMQFNRIVKVYFTLPITFKLQ